MLENLNKLKYNIYFLNYWNQYTKFKTHAKL